jgi:hypothetical protein
MGFTAQLRDDPFPFLLCSPPLRFGADRGQGRSAAGLPDTPVEAPLLSSRPRNVASIVARFSTGISSKSFPRVDGWDSQPFAFACTSYAWCAARAIRSASSSVSVIRSSYSCN